MDIEKHFECEFVSTEGGSAPPLYIRPLTRDARKAIEDLGPIEGFRRIAGYILFEDKGVYDLVLKALTKALTEEREPPRGGQVQLGV